MTLLQHPVFRRLYAAHIVHIIGNEFTFIAVVGLLHDLSGWQPIRFCRARLRF
ncbi:hypothetical protein [Brevibacillus agri]|uniref:hypothetical protein n=1 Tax=Brevibacillus agri TaxID=51101 RepID=UPI003D72A828